MTTIAYNHRDKQIAVDSRESCQGTIYSDEVKKWIVLGETTFFMSGRWCDCMEVCKHYLDSRVEINPKASAGGMVVESGVIRTFGFNPDDGFWVCPPLEYSHAIGSGRDHAMTAMDMGASAEGAVVMAMKRDCGTGGAIHVYDVAAGAFIK